MISENGASFVSRARLSLCLALVLGREQERESERERERERGLTKMREGSASFWPEHTICSLVFWVRCIPWDGGGESWRERERERERLPQVIERFASQPDLDYL